MQKQRTLRLLALLSLWLVPAVSVAATIATGQSTAEYNRVVFAGNAPQQLRVDSNGTTVTLHLSDATGDVSILTNKLKPHVTSANRSADGKTVTLTLDKPYRVRQFVSGNAVGIDILKNAPAPAAPAANPISTKPAEAAPSSILSTKPAVAPVPAPAPVAVAKPVPAPKPVAPAAKPAPEPKPILTTKEEPQAPLPVVAPAPEPKPILTTKEEPQAPIEKVTPAENPVPATEPAATESEFFEGAKPAETPPTDAVGPAPQPAPVVAATNSFVPEDILVGVRDEAAGLAIDFPWTERVATAVFQRGRDIWVIFNKESRIDALRLRTILPTTVINITRYKMPGNTVIKMETDGSVNASIETKQGSYGWSVRLLKEPVVAQKETPIQANTDQPQSNLMFQVFDTGEPLSFYDPSIGDRWLVTPLYEAGLGIGQSRKFPAFEVLPSPQGIAVLTQRPEIAFQKTRIGLKLTSPNGLGISKDLPFIKGSAAPVRGGATSNVMLPYDRWYVEPGEFYNARSALFEAMSTAPDDMHADFTTQVAELYLGQGFGMEAASFLDLVKQTNPTYYAEKKLALMRAAANFMAHRMEDAAADIKSPELFGMKEAQLWKDVISLYVPLDVRVTGAIVGPKAEVSDKPLSEGEMQKQAEEQLKQIAANATIAAKGFDYLSYNGATIQFYPPSIRQRLAIVAADAYIDRSKYGRAVRVFDSLNKEGLLEPVQLEAEYLLGRIAAERGKPDEARKAWEPLAAQESDAMIRARAAYSLVVLDYTNGKIELKDAIRKLDAMRISWRGDEHERDLLEYLGQLYLDDKQFDMALRLWKELTNTFPNDPEVINITTRTSELFERLFYDGQADELSPLKSLALFYEFRELTPVGEKGNAIIQKLADRLAAVDLIDRAAQLLEHQIKFRLAGEERARVGARLALLYLIDREPEKALNTLEITNFGDMDDSLRLQRLRLSAKAMAALDRLEEALSIMTIDQTEQGQLLRLEILWQMKDWANVINQAEDMMALRKDLTAPLTEVETEVLLKLALAYSFEQDFTQLNYLRDYYTSLMSDSPYKDIFSYITNNTSPIDPEDFALVTQQISRSENFMKEFRDKIAKGKLSETVK